MKKDFITAYCWMFGSTRKEAIEVYKKESDGFIQEIINCFKENAKRNFYE